MSEDLEYLRQILFDLLHSFFVSFRSVPLVILSLGLGLSAKWRYQVLLYSGVVAGVSVATGVVASRRTFDPPSLAYVVVIQWVVAICLSDVIYLARRRLGVGSDAREPSHDPH